MKNNFSITVSINTYNRPDALSECLQSLKKQTFKNFDIIIVNGGDRKPVEEIVKRFNLSIKIIQQIKKGLVEARNFCWKETQADIVCIIDDDSVVSKTWLEEVLKTFSLSEQIGGVTGPTLIGEEREKKRDSILLVKRFEKGNIFWRSLGRFYLNFILQGRVREIGRILDCGTFSIGSNFSDCLSRENIFEVDYLEACHMCFRRKLIEQAGGFDYVYKGTGEWNEPDLAFKVKKLGYRLVFNPKAITEHRISIQGVFQNRTYAFERIVNFITFYFTHIKPNTLSKIVRFYLYLFFVNWYWIYKTLSTNNTNWLSGILVTVYGLWRNLVLRCFKRN